MTLSRGLVDQPRPAPRRRRRWHDRLASRIATWSSILSSHFRATPPDAVDASPYWLATDEPAREAQRLYDRWLLSAGPLWITGPGDAARRVLVEHLQRHPELLVEAPIWRGRLVEVNVSRATQVLLPHDYDQLTEACSRPTWLTDEIRDMLHGLGVIDGARIPPAITSAFITADRLLTRYDDARTYEETPLGVLTPGGRMDEFPECDESIEAANDLVVFLCEHPELAGTRDFAAWFEAGSFGPHHDGVRRPG